MISHCFFFGGALHLWSLHKEIMLNTTFYESFTAQSMENVWHIIKVKAIQSANKSKISKA